MPVVMQGRRARNGKVQCIAYDGRDSLLSLLNEAEDAYLNLLEEAARNRWLSADVVLEHDAAISHLVIKHDVPQS